eukprot:255746_1
MMLTWVLFYSFLAYMVYRWFFGAKQEPAFTMPEIKFPDTETRDFKLEELKKYDGANEDVENRIYVSIRGKIYDVTRRPEFYGPGGPYNCLAGHDATYALAKGSLDEKDLNIHSGVLSRSDEMEVSQWEETFQKYHVVGKVTDLDTATTKHDDSSESSKPKEATDEPQGGDSSEIDENSKKISDESVDKRAKKTMENVTEAVTVCE